MLARLEGQAAAHENVPPRTCLPRLESVVAKALTRDPGGRYPTMNALSNDLAPFAREGAVPYSPDSLTDR